MLETERATVLIFNLVRQGRGRSTAWETKHAPTELWLFLVPLRAFPLGYAKPSVQGIENYKRLLTHVLRRISGAIPSALLMFLL